jgi:hypothetical protein
MDIAHFHPRDLQRATAATAGGSEAVRAHVEPPDPGGFHVL